MHVVRFVPREGVYHADVIYLTGNTEGRKQSRPARFLCCGGQQILAFYTREVAAVLETNHQGLAIFIQESGLFWRLDSI